MPRRRKIEGETTFHVPELAAGERVMRNFAQVFPHRADPVRQQLKGYNRSPETITVRLDNSERFQIGPDNFVEIERDIRWYTVGASGPIDADLVEFFENDLDDDEEEDAV